MYSGYYSASIELISFLEERFVKFHKNAVNSANKIEKAVETKLKDTKEKIESMETSDTFSNRIKYALNLIRKFVAVSVFKVNQSFVPFDSYKSFISKDACNKYEIIKERLINDPEISGTISFCNDYAIFMREFLNVIDAAKISFANDEVKTIKFFRYFSSAPLNINIFLRYLNSFEAIGISTKGVIDANKGFLNFSDLSESEYTEFTKKTLNKYSHLNTVGAGME